jgi:hypothetical protein
MIKCALFSLGYDTIICLEGYLMYTPNASVHVFGVTIRSSTPRLVILCFRMQLAPSGRVPDFLDRARLTLLAYVTLGRQLSANFKPPVGPLPA